MDSARPREQVRWVARWLGWWRSQAGRVVFLALLHGLAWNLLLPAWQGEDEPWHYEYARQIADGHWPGDGPEFGPQSLEGRPLSQLEMLRRFPGLKLEDVERVQREVLESMRAHGWFERVDFAPRIESPSCFDQVAPGFTAANQPWLYYALASAPVRLIGAGDVERGLWAARALSLLLFCATVWAIHAGARLAMGEGAASAAVGIAAALWPMHARAAAVVSNDVLANALSAGACLCALRACLGERRQLAWAWLCALAALMTKPSASGALIVAALASWQSWSGWRAWAAAAGALAVGAAAAWYWNAGHSPVLPRSLANVELRLHAAARPRLWGELWAGFCGVGNWNTRQLPAWVYAALLALPALALLGLPNAFRRADARLRRALVLWLVLLVAQLALIAGRGVATGRYLLPAGSALFALGVAGSFALVPQLHERRALRAAGIAMAAIAAGVASWLLVRGQYLEWGL